MMQHKSTELSVIVFNKETIIKSSILMLFLIPYHTAVSAVYFIYEYFFTFIKFLKQCM